VTARGSGLGWALGWALRGRIVGGEGAGGRERPVQRGAPTSVSFSLVMVLRLRGRAAADQRRCKIQLDPRRDTRRFRPDVLNT
jgi:hypothetical protein